MFGSAAIKPAAEQHITTVRDCASTPTIRNADLMPLPVESIEYLS
jgi:hypothetical protein